MTAYFRFIIKHRFLVLAVIFLLTIAAGAMLSQAIFASTIGGMFLGEDPAYATYLEKIKLFGNNELVALVLPASNLFSSKTRQKISRVAKNIEPQKYIRSVRTVFDLQKIEGKSDELVISSYDDLAQDPQVGPEKSLNFLLKDPFGKGLFISNNGRYTAVIIELTAEEDIPAEAGPSILTGIREAAIEAGYSSDEIRIVGTPANIAAIIEATHYNIKRLFPIISLVLLIAVWLMFRRIWPVILTLGISLIAVIWTMGFAVALDRHVSILTSSVPAVILIISFSDVIHLCSAYLIELSTGKKKELAIFDTGIDVGKACILTSATTFIGFVAMSFVPTPVFRLLGMVLGFGVGAALLLAVTISPILFSFMPRPKQWRKGSTGKVQDGIDRFLNFTVRLTTRHAKKIAIVFALVFIVSGIGLTQFEIETDFTKRLSEDHPARQNGDFFKEHFSGANVIDVYVDSKKPDGLLDPTLQKKIADFQTQAMNLPGTKNIFSINTLFQQIHQALSNSDVPKTTLPTSRAAFAQYLLLFEMGGGEDLDRIIDPDRQVMRISIQLPSEAVRETAIVGTQLQDLTDQTIGDAADVEVTGMIFMMGRWLGDIIAGQQRGLAFAFIAIAIMMIIGLRSIRVGLWSMLPNVLPILVLGGYLGIMWGKVDSDLLGLAMIAIGIGVDDTIHFFMRLKIECRRTKNMDEAVEKTFNFSGRGIVITTVILVVGFIPFATSDYLSTRVMGTLLPMTLIVALLADLLLAPALVHFGLIRFKK